MEIVPSARLLTSVTFSLNRNPVLLPDASERCAVMHASGEKQAGIFFVQCHSIVIGLNAGKRLLISLLPITLIPHSI